MDAFGRIDDAKNSKIPSCFAMNDCALKMFVSFGHYLGCVCLSCVNVGRFLQNEGLHLIRKVFRIGGHIHDTDHIQLGSQEVLIANGLEDHASDSAKAIDTNLGRHDREISMKGQLKFEN